MSRAYKHQEFLAHSGDVNCLQIGRKSGRVLVTGGEDRKVNMWAIGKPNCIMSLTGHTSAVECVTFDTEEEVVVAGSAGGTLKLWDLAQQKVVRNMVGHRSSCVSVDFHPYGDFFASGSTDTNLKVWDVRRKSCISTYKGHNRAVTVIRFSPDGRWLCSGSEDGTVKLWDLAAGKLMHSFSSHEGPISSLDFHPTEYMLSTASTDRTVKFWDLETFSLISSADQHTTPVRSMTFAPDGSALLAAAQDALKVWGWEPVRIHDHIDVAWNQVSDIQIVDDQLVGCGFNQGFVSVWIAEMSQVSPFSQNCPAIPANMSQDPAPTIKLDFKAQTPPVVMESPRHSNKDCHSPLHSKGGMAFEVPNPKAKEIPKQMPRPALEQPVAPSEPWQPVAPSTQTRHLPAPPSYQQVKQPPPPPTYDQVIKTSVAKRVPSPEPSRQAPVNPQPIKPDPVPGVNPNPVAGVSLSQPNLIPAHRDTPVGLDIDAFLPGGKPTQMPDDEILRQTMEQHHSMCGILNNRLTILRAVHTLWAKGDFREAILLMAKMKDPAVVVDVLTHAQLRTAKDFTLDMAVEFLPLMQDLLASRFEDYIVVALETTNVLLKGFSSLIKMTRAVAGSARGDVDISREERLDKCNKCFFILQHIEAESHKIAKHDGRVGTHAQELLRSFDAAKLS
eukprot:TRINITY_DN12047_c0_g1_i1.p1 TRINITY_DN12047_c0_g1~~TRINITY_DN12047_c0_g1_i1.p1  ORF type:complete len:670 (+),score=113.01 TRINITY_DN12047_c0_g1_i1:73-2082(+)